MCIIPNILFDWWIKNKGVGCLKGNWKMVYLHKSVTLQTIIFSGPLVILKKGEREYLWDFIYVS